MDYISDNDLRTEYVNRFFLKPGSPLTNSSLAHDHCRTMIEEVDREHFIVIFLSARNEVIDTEVVHLGTINQSAVYPREIIKKCLDKAATAIICAHNHPSGNPQPSSNDIRITKQLKDACKTMAIYFNDHIILHGENYYSFADHGLI